VPGFELLTYAFMQRAFLAGIAVAIVCPLIGVFLVLRRLSLLADGLGHVTFAGLAAGFLFGIYPLFAALVAAIIGAVGIERIRTRGRIAGDAAIAMFYTAGLALGRAAGLPALAVNTLLAALAAITTVAAMQIVGLLLVSSLMVLPALTAIRLAKSFRGTLAIAVAAALIAVLVGLTLSFYLDSAPGGTIVLTALAVFGLASLAERRQARSQAGRSPGIDGLPGR
jgi:zinc transport system permease protein